MQINQYQAQLAALNLKAALSTSTTSLTNVDNICDANKPVSSAQSALNLKANLASPTFTGTIGGISKAMVGLGNDNIADSAKVVGSATTAGSAAEATNNYYVRGTSPSIHFIDTDNASTLGTHHSGIGF
jgi:hypothetical protein